MKIEPQSEHHWLQKLVGDWSCQMQCAMGPDQPPVNTTAVETVRPVGGLWTVAEGRGEMPGGGSVTSLMTLGFDPQRGKFVGTFVASVMTFLWTYEGTLDAAGNTLTLRTEGPDCGGGTQMHQYEDIVEIVSDDHRRLRSRMLGDDGQWRQIMIADYRRNK